VLSSKGLFRDLRQVISHLLSWEQGALVEKSIEDIHIAI